MKHGMKMAKKKLVHIHKNKQIDQYAKVSECKGWEGCSCIKTKSGDADFLRVKK